MSCLRCAIESAWSSFARSALTSMGFACLSVTAAGAGQQTSRDLADLSLAELLDIDVVSASNRAERLCEAPATVIVIDRVEIEARGYRSLLDLFDDLPGMDVMFSLGDTQYRNYWRGYRYTIGAPFLLMLDGVIFNHLYFNEADVLIAFPLSNIDRVEIVYGPASSIYGPNAFMGVINVLTRNGLTEDGFALSADLSSGSFNSRLVDAGLRSRKGGLQVSLSARLDEGKLDDTVNEGFEWTKSSYYSRPDLWGGFAGDSRFGGGWKSPWRHQGVDLRVSWQGTEFGVQRFVLNSGNGFVYPADRVQVRAPWIEPDLSVFLRHDRRWNDRVTSRSLLRYRTSGVDSGSYFIEGYNDETGQRLLDFSYWQSQNSSWSFFQDFEYDPSQRLTLVGGVKYEGKDLQKAYDLPTGPALPPAQVDVATYPFPFPASRDKNYGNRIHTGDTGGYAQVMIRMAPRSTLYLGGRIDHNTKYGTSPALRLGYVQGIQDLTFKTLYGEAWQEPVPRLLYGGWKGSGSDPDLKPERSRTIEVSLGRTKGASSHLLSVYHARSRDVLLNFTGGAKNFGRRRVTGLDYHFQARIPTHELKQLRLWAYYSFVTGAGDELYDRQNDVYEWTDIGNLAAHKVYMGLTAVVSDRITASLRGRYIGERNTVPTNPIRKVKGYVTLDGSLEFKLHRPLAVSIVGKNLLDRRYFLPGLREADSGDTPGSFDVEGVWHGSTGWYNSLMPQPGRSIALVLRFEH